MNQETQTLQFTLEPVDNQGLARFCGAFDENLCQIETALGISITRRGEHLSVKGAVDAGEKLGFLPGVTWHRKSIPICVLYTMRCMT